MRRKLTLSLLAATITLGLSACGSNAANVEESEATEESEAAEETVLSEEASEDSDQNTEINEQGQIETEAEAVETNETQAELIWYMDSEGIKNDELGIMVAKNEGILEPELTVKCSCENVEKENTWTNTDFTCGYYEGDLDSYLSEHAGMERGMLDDIGYAYAVVEIGSDEQIDVVFVRNGATLSFSIWRSGGTEESVSDYLSRTCFVETYQESVTTGCLAYLAQDGLLYCPALGIKIFGEERETGMELAQLKCSWLDGTCLSMETGWMSMMGTFINSSDNAQEEADGYIEYALGVWGGKCSVIEKAGEAAIGQYQYKGRGFLADYSSGSKYENWAFYSDETDWPISIFYIPEGSKYEDYLCVLEELE